MFTKISTHAPLAGRDVFCPVARVVIEISTHAPLAGRDVGGKALNASLFISTHAPLAGRDIVAHSGASINISFQPTRPLRGATRLTPYRSCIAMISTHAPLAGRDPVGVRVIRPPFYFNPRAPCGARPITTL